MSKKLNNFVSLISTAGFLSVVALVLLSYVAFSLQNYRGPSTIYFCLLLLVTLYSRKWALCLVIFLLPIAPALHQQLSFINRPAVPFFIGHPGLDICLGFITGVLLLNLARSKKLLLKEEYIPWPVGLTLIIIIVSAVVAIQRNLGHQQFSGDFFALIDKILLFKIIVRGDPYLPAVDILTYSVCAGLIGILKNNFKDRELESAAIESLVYSLYLSAAWGVFQSLTKFGLQPITYDHRRNRFFYGAEGFQPDLHAYGGLMLIGSIGLLGYCYYAGASGRKKLLFGAISLCWIALLLSKSRASIVFSFIAASVFVFLMLRGHSGKSLFVRFFWINVSLMTTVTLLPLLLTSSTMQAIYSTEYLSFELWNQKLSLRPELHRAALWMFSEFPLFGVGQGNFINLSASNNYTNYSINWSSGENTHNYFLQSLAELGATGFISFIILFFYPILHSRQPKKIIPICVLILAVFWGNLYSHSLLVRENLLLLAIAVAILYSNIRLSR